MAADVQEQPTSDEARVPPRPHGFVPIFSAEEAAAISAHVDEELTRWVRREVWPVDFYTLGAASYLDAVADLAAYADAAHATNPALRARFGWVYDALIARLEPVFGRCTLQEPLAHPGFHIFGHRPSHENNAVTVRAMQSLVASIHHDRQHAPHEAVWSTFAEVDRAHPLTFTVAIELPEHGAGLCVWDDDTIAAYDDGSAFVAHVRALDYQGVRSVPAPQVVPYRLGGLFYFVSDLRHQIAPSLSLSPSDRRLTLQGHGMLCDGAWRLYF